MAFSIRWQLVAATAAALTLAFAACGDEKKDGDDDGDDTRADAGGGAAGGGLGGLFDGGIDIIADLEDNVAGSACTANEDCGGKNATCAVTTPDGTGSCSGACMEDSNCGAGGKCVKVASLGTTAVSFCAKTCTGDSQCDSKLQCRKTIDVRGVLDDLFEFLDAGIEDVTAEETPQICQEKADTVELANGAVGKACTAANAATVCGGGTCEVTLNPGGYCTGSCLADSDCGNTGGCARDALSATLGLPGSCRVKCTADTQCRDDEGYVCLTQELLFGPGKYCAAPLMFDAGGLFPTPDSGAGPSTDSATPAADAASGDAGT